jgi:putative endonuclease
VTRRRRAYLRGRRAETLAAWLLRLKGYRILARDFRLPVGEIDLVARRGGVLAVVEVKRRSHLAAGLEAVTPRQRRRLARAAEAFQARHPRLRALRLRFDVVVVVPGALPRHIADAWRP